jgi:hypothetical protein
MRYARVFTAVAILMFASSSLTDAQTSATASSTRDDTTSTVTIPASGAREKRFAPGTIAKTIVEEASRLTTDAITWGQKLHELELDIRNNASDVESSRSRLDECLFVLRAIAARLAPTSETRISFRKQEDAIRDLASRAEVRAEQSIRKIAGYLQQKTTELHTLNRSMEEIRIQLTTQIDHLQDQLAFNHAAAQNGESLKGAQNSLERLQALTANAQRLAADLDSFGGNPVVPATPADGGSAVEATKPR